MPWNADWIALEAIIFGRTLDGTVVLIYSAAYEVLTNVFEKQRESLEGWSESDSGISGTDSLNPIRTACCSLSLFSVLGLRLGLRFFLS